MTQNTYLSKQVESYDVLDTIIQNFPAYTREGDNTVIVDMNDIVDTDDYDDGSNMLEEFCNVAGITTEEVEDHTLVQLYK